MLLAAFTPCLRWPQWLFLSLVVCGSLANHSLLALSPQTNTETAPSSVAATRTPQWPGQASEWKGFQRFDFRVADRKAFVVRPEHPAPGNPWVWRARFPNYHSEVDQILLSRGFHIAYIQTDGLLGSPAAMEIWDEFYEFVVNRKLARRVALEGVSRGGLFVYAFAARWPERVACLYADTPVCDIRSWPGGKGTGLGNPATWQLCLQEYGLTEETAEAFRQNPIDQAEVIVKAEIPLLHIVTLNDRVVPPTENTFVLQTRIEALGGRLEVITVPEGTEASNGHHFTHPDPCRVADFMERHGTTPSVDNGTQNQVPPTMFSRLRACRRVFEETGRGRVAFVGGSITAMSGWREIVQDYLRQRFPNTQFEFVDAGVPSTGSVPGAFRLAQDVLAKGTVDLLFEEASVNDLTNGRSESEMIRGMEGIVRHTLTANPAAGVVVMHFACPDHSRDYRAGQTPDTIERHERVARHYGVATIDLAREVTERIDAGQFDWANDFRNLHPSDYGHRLYAAAIRRCLSAAWDSAPLDPSQTKEAKGAFPPQLDSACYDQGQYLPLETARELKGFEVRSNVDPRTDGVGGGVRNGFHQVPMLVATQPGSQFELPFRGRAVGLFVVAGPDAGIIDYRVDGGPWRTINLFTRWSRGLHLPWVHVLDDELPADSAHTLQIRVSKDRDPASRGHACRIVHLLVNP